MQLEDTTFSHWGLARGEGQVGCRPGTQGELVRPLPRFPPGGLCASVSLNLRTAPSNYQATSQELKRNSGVCALVKGKGERGSRRGQTCCGSTRLWRRNPKVLTWGLCNWVFLSGPSSPPYQ